MFSIWPRAPSAVCVIEIASSELRIATLKLLTADSILEAIAEPAASSAAEFILKPEDNLSIALDIDVSVESIFFKADRAAKLVLTVVICFSFKDNHKLKRHI